MTQGGTGEQVAARIGFAEQWLARARGQVSDGQLARGVLTLVLAQAEVHHAMEMAGAPVAPRRGRVLPAVSVLALASLAVLAGVRFAAPQAPPAVEAGPPIVRLSVPVGELLNLIVLPDPGPAASGAEQPAPKAVRSSPARIPVRSIPAPQPAVAPAANSTPAPSVQTTPPSPAAAPAAAPAAPASPSAPAQSSGFLSPRELIDLVLTAGNTLRADPLRR